jgi:hypothetical protein
MKQFVKIKNQKEMDRLLKHFKAQGWRASVQGLVARSKQEKNYPFVVGNYDNYAWYMNDEGTDTNMYISLEEALYQSHLTVEKTIYIPYYAREKKYFTSDGITIQRLRELHEEGKLNPSEIGIRYVEKYMGDGPGTGRMGFTAHHDCWRHFECKLNSFDVKNFSTINSYTDVGRPKYMGSQRMSSTFSGDYWAISINISPEHEKSPGVVTEKWLEITFYNHADPYTGICKEIRLGVERDIQPSNYLYYCLF